MQLLLCGQGGGTWKVIQLELL